MKFRVPKSRALHSHMAPRHHTGHSTYLAVGGRGGRVESEDNTACEKVSKGYLGIQDCFTGG